MRCARRGTTEGPVGFNGTRARIPLYLFRAGIGRVAFPS